MVTECVTVVGGVLIILGVAVGLTNYLVNAQVPAILVELGLVHSLPILFGGLNDVEQLYAPADLLERIRLLLVRKRGPKRMQQHPPHFPQRQGVA